MTEKIIDMQRAGDHHQVTTFIDDERKSYRRRPCDECPWRKDQPPGEFPAEAFRLSARTAYDASTNMFACHMTGVEKSSTCAGFLLRNSDNNVAVRIAELLGYIDRRKISTGGVKLYKSYREMAIANGVKPSDLVLEKCRSDHENQFDRSSS